ncbi:MAG: kinase/pyrophosphorylase [Xanthomonadales bacterium]|nr:kinase/pyrophosphorylase [Gammaproteobacteria bacterium]NNJ64840.1 kinase/pyrophosphorylase [Xanthomonadales bacterium]NNK38176.1 kinase/pyrophosphorylase [Xanthomonadales bacterium]
MVQGQPQQRTVFFVSDGTAITTETVGHSLLTQFPDVEFRRIRIPFIDSPERAGEAMNRIEAASEADGAPAIVFISIIDDETRAVFYRGSALPLDLFADFMHTLESVLGVSPQATVGQAHGLADMERYEDRIEATNYALAHDDGISRSYENAELILVGISRTGKTPTCLYMALHFGVKAANYPLTDNDLERQTLPPQLREHKAKIAGLIIDPDQLSRIRETRRPGSRYASLRQCHREVDAAESLLRREGIQFFDTTHSSIEEIASRVLAHVGLQRDLF